MNSFMVKKLIQKDWFAIRYSVYGCTLLGVIGLFMFLLGGFYGMYLGAVALDIAIIVLMTAIVIPVVILERKTQTLAFLLSLPISNLEFTLAKSLVCLGVYFFTWLLLYVAAIVVLLIRIDIASNLIPYFTVLYGAALMFYCLVFTVAIVTDSNLWTMIVFSLSNIIIQVSIGLGRTAAGIQESVKSPTMLWNGTIIGMLEFELIVIVLSLPTMLFLQLRKKDFL